MSEDYNPNSINAVLSRIETKLDDFNTKFSSKSAAQDVRLEALESRQRKTELKLAGLTVLLVGAWEGIKLLFSNPSK